MKPSSTWLTGTLARWVKISLRHNHRVKVWSGKHTHTHTVRTNLKQANLFTHDDIFSLFILMKSHSDGVAFSHTLLLSIFSSHYTAYPLSIQYQTFIMWGYNTITAAPSRELVPKPVLPCPKAFITLYSFINILYLWVLIGWCYSSTGEWSEIPCSTHVHTASDQCFWGQWVLGYGHVLWGWWRGHRRLHTREPSQRLRGRNGQGECVDSVDRKSVHPVFYFKLVHKTLISKHLESSFRFFV